MRRLESSLESVYAFGMGGEPERKSHVVEWSLYLAALTPFLYVLSIGPVAWLLAHHAIPPGIELWIGCFYKPLDWLHDSTPMRKPLEAYVEWWTAGRPMVHR